MALFQQLNSSKEHPCCTWLDSALEYRFRLFKCPCHRNKLFCSAIRGGAKHQWAVVPFNPLHQTNQFSCTQSPSPHNKCWIFENWANSSSPTSTVYSTRTLDLFSQKQCILKIRGDAMKRIQKKYWASVTDNAVSSCTLCPTCRTRRRNIHQVSFVGREDLNSGPDSRQSIQPYVFLSNVFFRALSYAGTKVLDSGHRWELTIAECRSCSICRWWFQVPPTTQNVINGVWEESSTDRCVQFLISELDFKILRCLQWPIWIFLSRRAWVWLYCAAWLSLRWVDVLNPATNQLVTKVPQSTQQVFLSHFLVPLPKLLFIQFTLFLLGNGASSWISKIGLFHLVKDNPLGKTTGEGWSTVCRLTVWSTPR